MTLKAQSNANGSDMSVHTSRSREQYHEEITRRLTELVSQGSSLESAVFSCDGAFPTDVLRAGGIRGLPTHEDDSLPLHRTPGWRVADQDLIQAEWYFDADTVERLCSTYLADGDTAYAIGCPTLAVEASRRGVLSTLVDSSPWLDFTSEVGLDHKRVDVTSINRLEIEDKAVLFVDPPWHLSEYQIWLEVISRSVSAGNRIYLVLPKSLSLRSAKSIRSASIEAFAPIGDVDVIDDAVRYETPLFEKAMLRSAGLPWGNWRTADLLELSVRRTPATEPQAPSRSVDEWDHYNLDGTVVRLQISKTLESSTDSDFSFYVPPTATSSDWVLRSPSMSLIASARINCVSSIGVGLSINFGMRLLQQVLARLSEGELITNAVESLEVGPAVRTRIRKAVTILVGREEGRQLEP
jgi:hypothetical protein